MTPFSFALIFAIATPAAVNDGEWLAAAILAVSAVLGFLLPPVMRAHTARHIGHIRGRREGA